MWWMGMALDHWANRVVVLAVVPFIGQPRLAHLVCRVRLQENTIAGNQLCMKQHHLRPHPLDRYWTTLMN
jgi:hypothetical protein